MIRQPMVCSALCYVALCYAAVRCSVLRWMSNAAAESEQSQDTTAQQHCPALLCSALHCPSPPHLLQYHSLLICPSAL